MANKTQTLTDDLYQYLLDVSVNEHPALTQLRQQTAQLGSVAEMQIAPEQGQFLQWFVRALSAKHILEIGTFTGYSAACMALGMAQDGQLITLDINQEWANIAKQTWQTLGVADNIKLIIAPALESLDALQQQGLNNHFDLVFIDAQKSEYIDYYEKSLPLTKPGGVIAIDNIFMQGSVVDTNNTSNATRSIRQFNQHIQSDQRVSICTLPIADGLTLALKQV